MAKCRACGTESQLDDTHRAGSQLMKNLPKDMSEIKVEDKKAEEDGGKAKDGGKDGGKDAKEEDGEASGEEEKKDKKKKKKKDIEEEEEPVPEEGIKLDSEEIGKLP